MSHLSNLNDYALDAYLRGDHGELMRREAGQELFRRGQQAVNLSEIDTDALIAELGRRGYTVIYDREGYW